MLRASRLGPDNQWAMHILIDILIALPAASARPVPARHSSAAASAPRPPAKQKTRAISIYTRTYVVGGLDTLSRYVYCQGDNGIN